MTFLLNADNNFPFRLVQDSLDKTLKLVIKIRDHVFYLFLSLDSFSTLKLKIIELEIILQDRSENL